MLYDGVHKESFTLKIITNIIMLSCTITRTLNKCPIKVLKPKINLSALLIMLNDVLQ